MADSGSASNDVNCVEKKSKERKEKKKKDKVADVPGQLEIVKRGRKKKNSDVPETRAEVETLAHNNLATEEKRKKRKRSRDEEQLRSDDKAKKQKKDQTPGPIAAVSPLEVTDIVEATEAAVTLSDPKAKEKKTRKNRLSVEISSCFAIEPAPVAEAADISAEPPSQSKSKSKKRKETNLEDADYKTTAAPTEDRSLKKRKKSKKSIHPNPSEDPGLTEQSQKALAYVYSQSTLPKTWKFNKARQNWLIRNFWTPKVPEKYVPMVVEYLSKVQGRIRETVVESCKAIISNGPESPAVQVGINEKTPPGNASSPTPTTAVSENWKRAETLLFVLTKD